MDRHKLLFGKLLHTLSLKTSSLNFRLANLTEASQIIDYICMCIIYIFFYRTLKVQGYDRQTLPYVGWWQPYCAWFGLISMIFTVSTYGYTTLLPGNWDIGTFFSYYTMIFLCPILYCGWKITKRSPVIKPQEADLVWERPVIDAYEAAYIEKDISLWAEIKEMAGFKNKQVDQVE
jgi:yeast amino acid transporter